MSTTRITVAKVVGRCAREIAGMAGGKKRGVLVRRVRSVLDALGRLPVIFGVVQYDTWTVAPEAVYRRYVFGSKCRVIPTASGVLAMVRPADADTVRKRAARLSRAVGGRRGIGWEERCFCRIIRDAIGSHETLLRRLKKAWIVVAYFETIGSSMCDEDIESVMG